MNVADAREVKAKVESIVSANTAGRSFDNTIAQWIASIPASLANKLANLGLIPPRQLQEGASEQLGPFIAGYLERRIDVKPATKVVWRHTQDDLVAHFGAQRDLAAIHAGAAEDFKLYLIGRGLAPTTIHKRLQLVRQFFRDAVRRKLITANPFAEVTAKAVVQQERFRMITPEEIERVLEYCNPTWKVIVALGRYGGLRCPSEVLSLRWEGIDWQYNRIVVESPKTAHHPGRDRRVIPLFPELRPILEEAYELASVGAEYVVDGGYRDAALSQDGWRNCNLRTQFQRILKRAGVPPWPKPFQNLRASRETELAREFPLHVVTEWLGNTPQIALKHYLRVTDEDFERAARPVAPDSAKSSADVAQNAAQQAHAPSRTDWQETTKAPDRQGLMRNRATPGDVVPEAQVAGTGFEREPFPPGNSQIATTGAAKSGAPDAANHKVEAELLEVIDAWPLLSADLREAVLTIVRAGRNG